MFKPQRIRDPLHDLIEFKANEFEHTMWAVLQTRPFQRLRRVKQLGFSDLVYPGATHSRFAHSIGVFHIARRLMRIIRSHLGAARYLETRAHQAIAAALVHDVGHGPFSHAFEDIGNRLELQMADHEQVSDVLIRNSEISEALGVLGSGFPSDVASIIQAGGPGNIYSAVVSSQFDADRLDYMRRDRLMTGTQHGAIDFEWLLTNVEVGEVPFGVDEENIGEIETFVLGPKAIHAAETYVLGLFQLYPTVYFHKTTRGIEKIFTELMCRTISLIRDDSLKKTGLSKSHPLVKFAKNPSSAKSVLDLDDSVITGSLPLLANAKDKIISNFANRLINRKLYKSINVREIVIQKMKEDKILFDSKKIDQICAGINIIIDEWISEKAEEQPKIICDQAIREPYKPLQESKGPLNQIRIRNNSGELVDLGEQSKIVRAIEPFRLFRVYVAEDDNESRSFVDSTIKLEVGNGAKS